jgi:hypothetical protein
MQKPFVIFQYELLEMNIVVVEQLDVKRKRERNRKKKKQRRNKRNSEIVYTNIALLY